MSVMYDGMEKKLYKYKGSVGEDFYCGLELDDIAVTLIQLDLGRISLQEAYIDILKSTLVNKFKIPEDLLLYNDSEEAQLIKALKSQLEKFNPTNKS